MNVPIEILWINADSSKPNDEIVNLLEAFVPQWHIKKKNPRKMWSLWNDIPNLDGSYCIEWDHSCMRLMFFHPETNAFPSCCQIRNAFLTRMKTKTAMSLEILFYFFFFENLAKPFQLWILTRNQWRRFKVGVEKFCFFLLIHTRALDRIDLKKVDVNSMREWKPFFPLNLNFIMNIERKLSS